MKDITTVDAHEALSVIRSGNALARGWVGLKKLKTPGSYRPPIVFDESKVDRTRVFNPLKGHWESRGLRGERGRNKKTEFTKKTRTTLLPSDGKIDLSDYGISNDGLLFDSDQCDLRDGEYIFNKNVSDNFWLKKKWRPERLHFNMTRSTPLEELKKKLANNVPNGETSKANTIFARLKKTALLGVFTNSNTAADRFYAFVNQQTIKNRLQLDLPIFTITPNDGVLIYNERQIKADVLKLLNMPHSDSLHKELVTSVKNNEFLSKLFSEEDTTQAKAIVLLSDDELYKQVVDLIKSDEVDLQQVSNAIELLCNRGARDKLKSLVFFADEQSKPNTQIIHLLLLQNYKLIPYLAAKWKKSRGGFSDDSECCLNLDRKKILLEGNIFSKKLLDKWPHQYRWLLSVLAKPDEYISWRYYDNYYIYPDRAMCDELRVKLLMLLPSYPKINHSYTKDEKQLILKTLLNELSDLKSEKEILEFHTKHVNAEYLSQHRHVRLQKLRTKFFSDPYRLKTASQNVFTAEVEKRLKEFDDRENAVTQEQVNFNELGLDRKQLPSAPSF